MKKHIIITILSLSIICQTKSTTCAQSPTTMVENDLYPEEVFLEVPEIFQYPELPTGCESIALTMVLQYEGFSLDKTTIADEYLIYNNETDNMALGYIGDPHSESGAGCFPPVLIKTAAHFLEDQNSSLTVKDLTGSSMSDLYTYISDGNPVIIWSTMYLSEPSFTNDFSYFEETAYEWYIQEHCVVLSGYDLSSQTVQINDPLEGIIIRDMNEFERIYDLTGKNAIVICEEVSNFSEQESSEKSSETNCLYAGIS